MFVRLFRVRLVNPTRRLSFLWPTSPSPGPVPTGLAGCWSAAQQAYGLTDADRPAFEAGWIAGTTIEQTQQETQAWRDAWSRKGVAVPTAQVRGRGE